MFNVGDVVTVVSCDDCSAIVGKSFPVKEVSSSDSGDDRLYALNFGRGRPQKGRPSFFKEDELTAFSEVPV